MIRYVLASAVFLGLGAVGDAQSMEDLKMKTQVHGFVTQGFLYTSRNSWNTTGSQNGSAAWNETAVNVNVSPVSRLRVGAQARYFVLGNYGKNVSFDWAQADFKINERFGVRAGKVKTPSSLLNENQDIDPAHLWIVLPQSIYAIASRTTLLSHYGGVAYGSVPLCDGCGKLEYRGFGGVQKVEPSDGVLQPERDAGLNFPSGLKGELFGATLRWRPPVAGLLAGLSMQRVRHTGVVNAGPVSGNFDSGGFTSTFYFASYERDRWMLAGEYNRFPPNPTTTFPGQEPAENPSDARNWYLMTSYKVQRKITAGTYYSYSLDRKAPYDMNRYQKDWTFSGRYDLNPSMYFKVEQHLVNGTAIGFSSLDNPDLQTRFNMSLVKLGVSF